MPKAVAGIGELPPTITEAFLGRAEVRQTFTVPKVGTIAGCYVTDGKVERGQQVRLLRDGVVIRALPEARGGRLGRMVGTVGRALLEAVRLEGGAERIHHPGVEGVVLLGPIERNGSDGAGGRDLDQGHQ